MNPLQQLISDTLDFEGLSQRQAVARSHNLITTATMSRIASGITVNLTERTINGLALALNLSPQVVREAAERTAKPQQLVEFTAACARLPARDLAEVVAFMERKLAEHDAAERARIKRAHPFSRRGRG